MKKIVIAELICIMAGSLCACGNAVQEPQETDFEIISESKESQASSDVEQETTKQEESGESPITSAGNDSPIERKNYDMPSQYEEIIEEYRTMITDKWDMEKIYEKDLCTIVAQLYDYEPLTEVGYVLYDLNHDDQPELLIGETDTEEAANRMIFDAYTIKDGEVEKLFTSQDRNRYYLIEDEAGAIMIANEGSNGAANFGYHYYIMNGTEMEVVQAILYDAYADEENPWFMAYDDDWDTSNDTAIDEQTAQDIIDSHTQNYAKLDWNALSE